MANITLKLGKHQRTEPIEQVIIYWSDGINVQRLKELVKKGVNKLLPTEQVIWDEVKDKKEWLYCFEGHIDNDQTIDDCYEVTDSKRRTLLEMQNVLWSANIKEVNLGTDVKLDIGKVIDQNIEQRLKQHFDDGDYLEHYRRDANIHFPVYINIQRGEYIGEFEEAYKDDYIDALETILIMGNVEKINYRLGVCNDMKIVNPNLFYPINKVSNISRFGVEQEIIVNFDK